jgi:hypothetical protein
MQNQRPKLKLYREEAKERLTTHWDLDYMTTAEIEAAMVGNRGNHGDGAASSKFHGTYMWLVDMIKRALPGGFGKTD